MKAENLDNERLQDYFKQIKKSVLKKFPNARTEINSNKEFYVVDENGHRILDDILLYPSQSNSFDAWHMVNEAIKARQIIDKNNQRFSDDKICKISEKGE